MNFKQFAKFVEDQEYKDMVDERYGHLKYADLTLALDSFPSFTTEKDFHKIWDNLREISNIADTRFGQKSVEATLLVHLILAVIHSYEGKAKTSTGGI